jgi:hypothetical protein
MKDQIAQRNKITKKKWPSILHVVGWRERIRWHQMYGKCIIGVAFIFTSKFHKKWNEMSKNQGLNAFKGFQLSQVRKK